MPIILTREQSQGECDHTRRRAIEPSRIAQLIRAVRLPDYEDSTGGARQTAEVCRHISSASDERIRAHDEQCGGRVQVQGATNWLT